jgi:cytochrome b
LAAVAAGVLETVIHAVTGDRRHNWVRTALLSLLAAPISWLAAGGSPAEFLTAADTASRATVAAHVVAVLVALILMYRPTANRFFRRAVREHL